MVTPNVLLARTREGAAMAAPWFGYWGIVGPHGDLDAPIGWSNVENASSPTGIRLAQERGIRLLDGAEVHGHRCSERLFGALVGEVDRGGVAPVSNVGYFSLAQQHDGGCDVRQGLSLGGLPQRPGGPTW